MEMRTPCEDRHGRRTACEGEAETGVMQPQAKECQEPPEAGRARRGSPLELTPSFWTFSLQNWENMFLF